jgi:hypothetical protein
MYVYKYQIYFHLSHLQNSTNSLSFFFAKIVKRQKLYTHYYVLCYILRQFSTYIVVLFKSKV